MTFKKSLVGILFLALLGGAGWFTVQYYSFVFSRDFKGTVVGIERVTSVNAIVNTASGNDVPASQLFSFAVAIQLPNGETRSASSEDRQWAVVEKGNCVEARFFPYPPWDFEKSNTYFGARLIRIIPCDTVGTK